MSATAALAGDASSPVSGVSREAPGGVIKLSGTIIQYGAGGTTLNSGFNDLDTSESWDCKDKKGCTIAVSAMVQIGSATTSGNWAICATVDGNYINPACPYQGSIPGTGSYVTGNSQQSYTVAMGTHTVQTTVYVTPSTTLENWQTTQQLLKGQ